MTTITTTTKEKTMETIAIKEGTNVVERKGVKVNETVVVRQQTKEQIQAKRDTVAGLLVKSEARTVSLANVLAGIDNTLAQM